MKHPTRLWILVPALAAMAARGASADDVPDPVDPVEDKALREEAKAQFEQALETFRQAFDACVEQAKAGGPARERNLARAEVLLEKLGSLSDQISRQGETAEFLARYGRDALGPVLESRVAWERANDLLAEGDRDGALRAVEPLGLLRRFWIVGPFDNEQGRGFRQEFGPEKKIDLDAEFDGKERKVRWREVRADHVLGYVDLDALLRPADQAAAYAAAFVKAPADADAALRLGSDEAVRAWWNGREVLSRDVRRQMAFDQDVAGVRLRAGWNVLLVKVHDQTGAWGFRARLTAPDGSPVAGLATAATPEEAKEALAAKPEFAEPATQPAGGAKAYYDAAVAAGGPAGARDLFHLGWLHHRRHFDSAAKRTAEEMLQKAAEAEPQNAVYRFHYSEAAAPVAELSVEKEENRQRAGREKAIELDPGHAVAYRALAGFYTSSIVNLERAEQLLRKALEVNPDFWQARLDLAGVLERRGLRPASEVERTRALESAGAKGVEEAARARASAAERKGLGPDAAAAWREVLSLDARGNDVRRRVAELAASALDRAGALAALDEIALWNPYDTPSRARKAEILEGAGDLAGAEASLREALAVAPEDDRLLRALGRVQQKAGRDRDALASYREALRVNPKDQQLERYVEFLDPEAAPYEDDFRIDVAPLAARAKDWQNAENDGWLTLLDHTVTKVNRDGTTSTYVHYAAKVLTNAGVERFDNFFAPAWGGEAFKWKAARVLKPDGSAVDAKTTSVRGNNVADFPPLEPGDVIDVEYRRDQRQQSVFGDYFGDVQYFADMVPALQSTWTLLTPAEREFFFHQRNMDAKPEVALRDDGRTRAYTWTRTDVAKVRQEEMMPGPQELFPQVQVTTYRDWNEFAKWWWSLIRDQSIASPEMKQKVEELTAGRQSRLEKIRAVYEFVTGEITYQAWPFGPHGYKPYTTTAIYEKKEGDCKDKALLFNTMLQEIGVESYPVLIRMDDSRGEEDLTLAMVGHFNHCIAYVPDADGKGTPMWFDGTAEYASAMLPPGSDQGARVIVVKPDGAHEMQVPRGEPETAGVWQKWRVSVHPDGSAVARGELTWKGDLAIFLRQRFSVEGQRPLILQALFSRAFGKLKVKSHEFDDLKDLSRPEASFRVELEIQGFAKGQGSDATLTTSFFDFVGGMLQGFAARPSREHDLVLPNPMSFRTEAEYELPEGWSVTAPPEDARIEVPDASYASEARHDGRTLRLTREMRLVGRRVEVSEYAAFRDALNRAAAVAQQQWKVRKGEAAAAPQAPPPAAPPETPKDEGGK